MPREDVWRPSVDLPAMQPQELHHHALMYQGRLYLALHSSRDNTTRLLKGRLLPRAGDGPSDRDHGSPHLLGERAFPAAPPLASQSPPTPLVFFVPSYPW